MQRKLLSLGALAVVITSCSITTEKTVTSPKTLADFQREGAKFKNVLRVPQFETTTTGVKETAENTMFVADRALDGIGALGPNLVNFASTVGALDAIGLQAGEAMSRLALLKETSTNS